MPPPRPEGPYWHYCVVREDLPLGTLAAMLVHAAGESAMRAENWCLEPDDHGCEVCRHDYQRGYGWNYDEGCGNCGGYGLLPDAPIHAVVLAAKDEAALLEVEMRLTLAEIHHRSFREPDPPWDGALMAVGIEPTRDRATLRRVLGKLKLLGEQHGQGTVSRSRQDVQGSREGGGAE